tara:strand:- start:1794 stop:2249 length:456 start_codon:yes stop_codon:yes gene_type:complete
MKLIVDRVKSNSNATLSIISIDGKFECFGLEDEYRDKKIPGKTRIPCGLYDVGVRTIGGFDRRYSDKFPTLHKGMLQVLNVPGFEYILIHIGNTHNNTEGCLLVGQGASTGSDISIQSSTNAYKSLYEKVIDAALVNNLTIAYVDNDHIRP